MHQEAELALIRLLGAASDPYRNSHHEDYSNLYHSTDLAQPVLRHAHNDSVCPMVTARTTE